MRCNQQSSRLRNGRLGRTMIKGIDLIRACEAFDSCKESVNQQFTAEQLLQIYRAWSACEWDFYPDQWSVRQLQEAADYGKVPQFRVSTRADSHHPDYLKYIGLVAVYSNEKTQRQSVIELLTLYANTGLPLSPGFASVILEELKGS